MAISELLTKKSTGAINNRPERMQISVIDSIYKGHGSPIFDHMWMVKSLPTFEGKTIPIQYVLGVELPFPGLGVDQTEVAATTISFPDKSEVVAFSMSIHEDSKVRTVAWLLAWQANIQDPYTGLYYLPTKYKRDIPVAIYNTRGEEIMTALLKGAWPSTISSWDLQGGGSGMIRNSVSFNCDAFIPNIGS